MGTTAIKRCRSGCVLPGLLEAYGPGGWQDEMCCGSWGSAPPERKILGVVLAWTYDQRAVFDVQCFVQTAVGGAWPVA
jgi:hypothetical protein